MRRARMNRWLQQGLLIGWLFFNGAGASVAVPGDPGHQAVQVAQSQLGVLCQNVTLPGYNVWGRHTNGCANLVAAVEAKAGTYRPTPGDAWVSTFEKALQSQGWRAIPRSQAQPGDVAIFHDATGEDQHTEIVASDGATRLIGNNGNAQEMVSYDSGNWGNPTFYTPARTDPHVREAQLQQARAQVEALEAQIRQVETERSRVQGMASNAPQWYQEGAISKHQADSVQQQATELKQKADSLSAALDQVRGQLVDAGGRPAPLPATVTSTRNAPDNGARSRPPGDAAYWQSLYDQGAISRAMLEQHVK